MEAALDAISKISELWGIEIKTGNRVPFFFFFFFQNLLISAWRAEWKSQRLLTLLLPEYKQTWTIKNFLLQPEPEPELELDKNYSQESELEKIIYRSQF